MAQRVSPGIYTDELQLTQVNVAASRTVPCILGGATKGPVDTPTLVTSEQDLIRKFGRPVEGDLGLLTAIEFLKRGDQLVYLRVTDSAVATAVTNALGKPTAVAGAKATGSITLTANPQDGDTVTIDDGPSAAKVFEFDTAIAATGTVTFTGLPSDGETIIISDGFVARTFEFDAATAATGSVTITASNAADGDQITLIDAAGRTVIFEFDNNAALTGDVAVAIGADEDESTANLVQAINDHPTLDIVAVDGGSGVTNLTQGTVGTAGNTTITEDGANISAVSFTGGENLAAGTAGNIAVLIGSDATACATNLAAAIEAQVGYRLGATSALGVVTLTNEVPGAAGNVSITEGLSNATASGMSGGSDAGVSGSNVAVAIGSTAAATATNLRAAINAQSGFNMDALEVLTGANPVVNLTNTVETAAGNVTVVESTSAARMTVTGMSGGVTPSFGSDTEVLAISAINPGSWFNDVDVVIQPSTAFNASAGSFDILVYAPVDNAGTLQVVERFQNLTQTDPLSARYVETVVNEGVRGEVRASTYTSVSALQPYNPNSATLSLGTDTAGADGITALAAADYVGTTSGATASGLQAARNAELVQFNILAVPGISHSTVITAMLEVATFRDDTVALLDVPFGLTVQQVVDWHNGQAFTVPNSPTSAIDSNAAIIAWPWIRNFSDYLEKNIWLPPSAALLTVFAYGDNNPGPWLAPAGHQRGNIPFGNRLEYSAQQSERDILLGGNNCINPIIEFTDASGTNFVFYGNETCQRASGPLDAIHVKRMVIFAKGEVTRAIRPLHFQPNDARTRRDAEQIITPILEAIQDSRGLERFVVKCDEDNNPAEVRAQKKLVIEVLLKHIDASEIIEVQFALFRTGDEIAS